MALSRKFSVSVPVYSCSGHDARLGKMEISYTPVGQAPGLIRPSLCYAGAASGVPGHLKQRGFLTYIATRTKTGVSISTKPEMSLLNMSD